LPLAFCSTRPIPSSQFVVVLDSFLPRPSPRHVLRKLLRSVLLHEELLARVCFVSCYIFGFAGHI
jgi:hypothetical protein